VGPAKAKPTSKEAVKVTSVLAMVRITALLQTPSASVLPLDLMPSQFPGQLLQEADLNAPNAIYSVHVQAV